MRIAQVVPSLEERHGGPSKSVHALSAALARLGGEVELLATRPGAGEVRTEGRLTVRNCRRDWPARFCASRELRAALAAADPEVVHHHAIWLRTLHYARKAACRRRVPLVVSPRGMLYPWSLRHHAWRKLFARHFIHPGAFEAVRGWHATSSQEENDIRACGFKQPVCVAPNGVEEPEPEEKEASALYWREACPEVRDRPVAVFYSRFHRKKRVLELIDLWLEGTPANWLLLMVGIPEEYSVAKLEGYVLTSLGSRRIRVFDGRGRPPPYAVASLFLLPSHGENFGMSIAEALACGVPALVTDSTPWSALNAAGAGWCVPWIHYPEALGSALAEWPGRLASRGAAARKWVLSEYSWERPARALADFYNHLKSNP